MQHIAIATDDIVKTVSELRRRGVEFLYVPETYYEDVLDRVGQINESLEELKSQNILIDRDEEGYLLQIFTKPVEDRPTLFFEIIERNALQLPAQHRNRWKDEMTRSVPRRDHSSAPERLILELANTCNLDCPMCRVGRYGVDSSRFMAPELFERVLGALPSLREVRLNGLGEATLHPRFEYFVRRVVDSGLHGELITN